jgi:multidrug efflux pump subunit AcrB
MYFARSGVVIGGLVGKLFAWSNQQFGRATNEYLRFSTIFVRRSGVTLIVLILSGVLAFILGKKIPTGFLPDEDQCAAPLLVISLYSPDGSRDALFLSNYAYINLNDALTRVRGISNVQISGAGEYAMRLWLKPDQLANLGLSVPDIVNAIQAQNTVNSAGQVGSEPIPNVQEYTYTARAQGRLTTPEEFGEIVVRQLSNGETVRLKDVARVELGAQAYNPKGRLNGKPAAVVSVYQLPGTNALSAAKGVRKLMEDLKQRFPQGLDYVVSMDTTKAVTAGIQEMVKTLVEALGLVILVVYLFLQSWRATLIPLLAVPVAAAAATGRQGCGSRCFRMVQSPFWSGYRRICSYRGLLHSPWGDCADTYTGFLFVTLAPWEERRHKDELWQVYVQAEGAYRTDFDNLSKFYVRNANNQMVPLSALTRFEGRTGQHTNCCFWRIWNALSAAHGDRRIRFSSLLPSGDFCRLGCYS